MSANFVAVTGLPRAGYGHLVDAMQGFLRGWLKSDSCLRKLCTG